MRTSPKTGDYVSVSARELRGLQSTGTVLRIDREADEVTIRYFGYTNIKYPAVAYLEHPEWFAGGGEYDTIDLDQFAGCWISHSEGYGEWQI